MIKLRRECGKGSFYYSKTRAPCELSITHNHELVTTSELLGFVVSIIFVITFFEFIIRKELYNPSKNSLISTNIAEKQSKRSISITSYHFLYSFNTNNFISYFLIPSTCFPLSCHSQFDVTLFQ